MYVCMYIYIYIYMYTYITPRAKKTAKVRMSGARETSEVNFGRGYTQFPSQDLGLFGPYPWKVLAPPSNYLSRNGFWATQPLGKSIARKNIDGNWV